MYFPDSTYSCNALNISRTRLWFAREYLERGGGAVNTVKDRAGASEDMRGKQMRRHYAL